MRLGTAVAKFGRCRRLRVVVTLFTSLCLSPYSLCLYLHLFLSLVPIATAVQAGPRPASLRARVSKPFEFEARSTAPNTPPFISRATGATSLSPPPPSLSSFLCSPFRCPSSATSLRNQIPSAAYLLSHCLLVSFYHLLETFCLRSPLDLFLSLNHDRTVDHAPLHFRALLPLGACCGVDSERERERDPLSGGISLSHVLSTHHTRRLFFQPRRDDISFSVGFSFPFPPATPTHRTLDLFLPRLTWAFFYSRSSPGEFVSLRVWICVRVWILNVGGVCRSC